jgi:hypothetical protein
MDERVQTDESCQFYHQSTLKYPLNSTDECELNWQIDSAKFIHAPATLAPQA